MCLSVCYSEHSLDGQPWVPSLCCRCARESKGGIKVVWASFSIIKFKLSAQPTVVCNLCKNDWFDYLSLQRSFIAKKQIVRGWCSNN